jgi:hypothetical protein
MSCCGKMREQIRQQRTFLVPPVPVQTAPIEPRTPVVFKGTGSYLVTGPNSGNVYHFSQAEPEQWIDAKDAEALITTRFFQAKR